MLDFHHPREAARWLAGQVDGTLHCDSRKLQPGDGFIAWPGAATDGRQFVREALARGAAACLVEAEGAESFAFDSPQVAGYRGLKNATSLVAAEYYGHPSEQIDVLAVTGTNGKTSTAWWLAQALSGVKPHPIGCAVIGTLGTGQPPHVHSTGLTTPDPVLLQRELRRFADAGLGACAMEASSIGIAEHRMDGMRIRTAIFTNLTQDHLDYHGTMQAYWEAKRMLFRWPGLQAAVVNVDDEKGGELHDELKDAGMDLWSVSCLGPARLRALDIAHATEGLAFTVAENGDRETLRTQLVGQYNVSNLLGVIAAMRTLGVSLARAVEACHALLPVPGRMERIGLPGQPLVAVDYSHTPDALDKALAALRPLARERGGKLWCVFGCGGDRDPVKRPIMAAVAEKGADHVVVTSDNPRGEKPEAIICQILLGLSHNECVNVQADRARAIRESIAQAAAEDVILIAGKGHEDYQEIAGVKHPFSDQAHAREALEERRA
ncbi:MAG TPA: UDP-N-acetylmuramoyl-L-alanyl-D-glutamate--2,6-diaminopimelate ligase [Ramlibacter sp.]|uniref:UDP-N-acetylmuramoyl-L-alanyl-D-glutamate--2, 6-diaminopimelate ligase n=1 Tax=Ramlibacter sp. TaxID=1917967 RepID=UPI002B5257A3|nr:UDP-N-acetylmuramoyl-L-alanyl-D-glutamate--2,6-diaminopimelate ligase [Ramlibacter sp.]HVZ45404.1 UDP-N-acetylmuramoyl-L-alanyl-D-glutamate--2,6-diaminopimelate ligase [Ramlibacter sp.]